MSPQVKAIADSHLVTWIAHLGDTDQLPAHAEATVAAYVPAESEPGSVAMLDTLRDHGHRVLLPIVLPGPAASLQWAVYEGPRSLTTGRFGILEPTGTPLPSETITTADLVLLPALAVDRRGVRLGRGAGYYDRTIHAVDTNRLVAVIFDDELLDEIPADEFDVPVGWTLTPTRGLQRLGTS